VDLPPAAIARRTEGDERRRVLARALHEPPHRTAKIEERLAELRDQIAKYREKAIELHARLVELEANGDDVSALRKTLIDSSVQLEDVVRGLIDSEPG
jgi:chromosome segregation ATPase